MSPQPSGNHTRLFTTLCFALVYVLILGEYLYLEYLVTYQTAALVFSALLWADFFPHRSRWLLTLYALFLLCCASLYSLAYEFSPLWTAASLFLGSLGVLWFSESISHLGWRMRLATCFLLTELVLLLNFLNAGALLTAATSTAAIALFIRIETAPRPINSWKDSKWYAILLLFFLSLLGATLYLIQGP